MEDVPMALSLLNARQWGPLSRLTRFISRIRAIRQTYETDDPDRLLDFFDPQSLGAIFRPLQKLGEIRALVENVRALRPRIVLEIGTNNGGTLFLFCRAAALEATIVSLDLPGGLFGGGYSVLRTPYYKSFASSRQRVTLLRMNSHDPSARRAVRSAVGDRPIDFLFIDGDHTYAGVKQDFETYAPLVRPGGLIALHDIVPAPAELGIEVPRFWAEIKRQYDCQELIEDSGEQKKMGIGLIRVPDLGLGLPETSQ
jgi:predicted O-methyltransferase YrrM